MVMMAALATVYSTRWPEILRVLSKLSYAYED